MKKLIKYLFCSLILAGFSSCGNFLDILPDDTASIDKAFSMRSSAKKYLFTCYSYMPVHGLIGSNPAIAGGDEITHTTSFRSSANVHAWYIANGSQGPSNVRCNFWQGTNGGKDLYQAISDCNIFLDNIHKVPDMSNTEKDRWRNEVKFLKAYYHFWLVRMYGPVPIKDKNIPVSAPQEQVQVHRNTLDECFDYIVRTLDEIIDSDVLPGKIINEAEELGRITTGIAMAVKAEVLMTAASPLFNGNSDYAGFVDNRGVEIFCPDKTEAQKRARWQAAADACKEAIDYLEALGHGLYYYDALEYVMSDATRAKMNIRMSQTEKWNKEVVWGNSNSRVGALQTNAIPRGLEPAKSANGSAAGNLAVPLKIAAQFYTSNGVPITEDRDWKYEERFDIRAATADEKYFIKQGYKTAKFNFNREIRYYASLGFDGCVWFGQGVVDENNPIHVQAKKSQGAGNSAPATWNDTGIWPKKLVHFKTTVGATSGVTQIQYAWPVIKMSSLYLYYAEALNELNTAWEDVLPWVDIVRERASLDGVEDSWTQHSIYPTLFQSQSGLRGIIQQERMIETAFEGHRFWDLRRWKRAHTELNKPMTGWNTEYSADDEYYVEKLLFNQSFSLRDYFWPVANSELYANKNTLQNYGW